MKRSFAALSRESFDLLVVGGGIQGATAAWASAWRGLKVALVEQGDFGSSASANSLKIIHGGFRYLQHGDIPRMRESIRARRELLKLAPHLVRPLACMVPTWGLTLRSRAALAAALFAASAIGWDRNQGLRPDRVIPSGHLLSRQDVLALLPLGDRRDISGGAVWHDALVDHAERLTLSFVLSAAERGAVTLNHARAMQLAVKHGTVTGAVVMDTLTGEETEVQARHVLVAGGPGGAAWLATQAPGLLAPGPLLQARNVVLRKRVGPDQAFGLELMDDGVRQNLFFVPWRGVSMVGTLYKPVSDGATHCTAAAADVEKLLAYINRLLPDAGLGRDDVALVHAGLQRARAPSSREPVRKSIWLDAGDHGGPDGLHVGEVCKLTTAVVEGQVFVEKLLRTMNHPGLDARDATLYGGESPVVVQEIRQFARGAGLELEDAVLQRLLVYGSRYHQVVRYAAQDPQLAERIPGTRDALKAEVVFAVRDEMACRLSDVVLRRCWLGNAGHPGEVALSACADLMARELAWNSATRDAELVDLHTFYTLAGEAVPG